MKENNIGIYKITNTENGKFYIGSSKHIDRRWWEHKDKLINNRHDNPKLQHAWNYYGESKFVFDVIEVIEDQSQLLLREQHYLDLFKPYIRNIGYNIGTTTAGGDNFTHHPNKEEIRKNLSDVNMKDKNPMYGKKHSEDSLVKLKTAAKDRFSLKWFIDCYGEEEGTLKYKERNEFLKNRDIQHVYDNGLTGKKRGAMSDENKLKISENKKRMKLIKDDLISDIKQGIYTIQFLSDKYNISTVMIKYYKRRVK